MSGDKSEEEKLEKLERRLNRLATRSTAQRDQLLAMFREQRDELEAIVEKGDNPLLAALAVFAIGELVLPHVR